MRRTTGRTAELRQCDSGTPHSISTAQVHALHDFAVVDLSAFYFDVLKDRFYTFAARNRARRSAQTAVYRISSALLRLAAPILAFTSEETWKYFPKFSFDPDSVHLALFPKADELDSGVDDAIKNAWQSLLELRGEVLKALEEKRNEKFISGSLEAKVRIHSGSDARVNLLERYKSILPALFIVSRVEIANDSNAGQPDAEKPGGLKIEIVRADGKKCERCWNYSTHVGEDADYPTVCERCVAALREIEQYPEDNKGANS